MGESLDDRPAAGTARYRRHRGWLIAGAVVVAVVVVLLALWLWLLRTQLGTLAQAAVDTLARDTAATRIDATAGGLPLVGEVALVVADGEVDFEAGTARFRRELVGGAATEIRYTSSGTYLQLPLTADRWVALDGAGTSGDAATGPPSGDAAAPLDVTQVAPGLGNPVALIGLVRALEEPPAQSGTEPLDVGSAGTPVTVTTYRAVVDLDTAGDTMTGDAATVIADLRRLTGSSRLPVTVGIDGQGLIRLVRFEGSVPLVGPVVAQLETEIVFTAFGVPVDVDPPPTDRIVDVDAARLAELDPFGALRDLLQSVPGG